MKTSLVLSLVALLLGSSLTACYPPPPKDSGSSDSGDKTNTAASSGSGDRTSTAASPPKKRVFTSDLEAACNGVPVPQAAAYDKTAGNIHPIAVFYRNDRNKSYIQGSKRVPDAWQVPWQEAAKTELVACLTAVERKLIEKCSFKDKDDANKSYTLEMYDTVYEIAIYETKTGKLVETTRLDLKAEDKCPMMHFFSGGETTAKKDAKFEQALLEFAKPHVQPST